MTRGAGALSQYWSRVRRPAFYKPEEAGEMAFIKADLEKEREELNRLISGDEDARKAHQEFQARVAYRQRLIQMRKEKPGR